MNFDNLVVELKLRGYSKRTIESYVFHNRKFLEFIRKEPRQITQYDIKRYLLHLIENKKSKPRTVNLAVSALKFYYREFLKRNFNKIRRMKQEKHLPLVIPKDAIKRMISATKNPKHMVLIEIMYSSGLRVTECVKLRIDNLNLNNRTGIVKRGKGKKDRMIILSKRMIEDLRRYLETRKDSNPYVFISQYNSNTHISARTAQKIIENSARKAGISRIYCHALRASFATHLINNGTDISLVQKLLGHSSISTTQNYIKVSTKDIKDIKNPLDY